MATKSTLRRGFKSNAERLAIEYREKLSLHACDALCAFKLAKYLEVPVYSATDFLTSQDDIDRLSGLGDKDCGWSALTMPTLAGNRIIIHNPYHTSARQQSNVMHELAHIICKHERGEQNIEIPIPLGMRHFDEEQEEEAKCLGAVLQITRPGLLWARNRNMTTAEIASYFNASHEMVTYRMNTSGVIKQMIYRKAK